MSTHFEVDGRCTCGGKLTWIQCVRLFDDPDTVELTARCSECMAMYEVRVILRGEQMNEEELRELWIKLTRIYGDLYCLEVPPELVEVHAARDAARQALDRFHFSGPEHEISIWVDNEG